MYYVKCNPWKRTMFFVGGIILFITLNVFFLISLAEPANGTIVSFVTLIIYAFGAKDVFPIGNEKSLKFSRGGGGKKQTVWKLDPLCLGFRCCSYFLVAFFWMISFFLSL